jgi:hypothetical protein
MRYLAAILGLLLASHPVFAHNHKMILPQLVQEMSKFEFLPVSMQATTPSRMKITYLPEGALARWNPKTDTFEVSKAHWKKSPHVHCLLPLFVHESVHSYFVKKAHTLGFAWPVTIQDEVPAFYYQLVTEEALAHYTQECAVWHAELTPQRRALTMQNWDAFQTAIYEHYSQFPSHTIPPPPFAQPWIEQARHQKKLIFYQRTYLLHKRSLTAARFWRKGGSWLRLSPAALKHAQQDPRYALYKTVLKQLFNK